MQNAEIYAFPHRGVAPPPVGTAAAPPAPIAQPALRPAEIDIFGVAKLFGISHRPIRAIIDTIRKMHLAKGFPLPKNPRIVKGDVLDGAEQVCRSSIWRRDDVEVWFDGDAPPPVSAARQLRRKEDTRAALAAAARRLVL